MTNTAFLLEMDKYKIK